MSAGQMNLPRTCYLKEFAKRQEITEKSKIISIFVSPTIYWNDNGHFSSLWLLLRGRPWRFGTVKFSEK